MRLPPTALTLLAWFSRGRDGFRPRPRVLPTDGYGVDSLTGALELLVLRAASCPDVVPDLPALAVDVPRREQADADRLREQWPQWWADAALAPEPLRDGPWQEWLTGPDRHLVAELGAREHRAAMRCFEEYRPTPEAAVVDKFNRATRRGLRTLRTLPLTGGLAVTVGPGILLVSDTTRADPVAYTAALDAFPGTTS